MTVVVFHSWSQGNAESMLWRGNFVYLNFSVSFVIALYTFSFEHGIRKFHFPCCFYVNRLLWSLPGFDEAF